MKSIKKALCVLVCAAVTPVSVAFAQEMQVPGEEILYYNSFPTGTNEDLREVEHERYYFYGRNSAFKTAVNTNREYAHNAQTCDGVNSNFNITMDALAKSEYNGDIGVKLQNANRGGESGPVLMLDFRYRNALKEESINPNGLNSGIYKLSFDFVNRIESSHTESVRVEANCYHGNCGNNYSWIEKTKWHVLNNGSSWNYADKNIAITAGELHTYEIIFDYDNEVVHTYMDGNKHKSISNFSTPIKFLHITMGGGCEYLDNILFTKMESACEMEITDIKYDTNGAVIEFSDYIEDYSDFLGSTIEDVYSGRILRATTVAENGKKLRIKPMTKLVAGREYVLNLKGELFALRGDSISVDQKEWFNFGESKTVKSMTMINYMGEKLMYKKAPVAEIDGFEFEFTEDVDAKTALSGFKITDASENEVLYTIEDGETQNKAKIVLTGALSGETKYTMTLSGMSIDYKWEFTTQKGKISLKPIKLYKEDGETPVLLSEVAAGDNIKAVLTVVNTSSNPEEISFLISAGLYSDRRLDGYDYEKAKMEAGQTTFTKIIDFAVKRTEDLSIKAFGWEKIDSRSPLMSAVVLR